MSSALERKAALASSARQAYSMGAVEEAMRCLSTLKRAKDATEEDLDWLAANEQALKNAAPPQQQKSAFFPRIADVKWRVDVTISTSSLERVMRPSVMLQLTLTDGRVATFEMPMEQLHKLRYSLARVLRTMQDVERNPIMRLIDADTASPSAAARASS